jgi:hypothetical protein
MRAARRHARREAGSPDTPDVPERQEVALRLDSSVGSTREVFVVEADRDGTAVLRVNHELSTDGSQDLHPSRTNPPPGRRVSAICRVVKLRERA